MSLRLVLLKRALLCVAWLTLFAGGAANARYIVQLGIYSKPLTAGQTARTVHEAGLPVKVQPIIGVPDLLHIRLFVGPYPDRRGAEAALQQLKRIGYDGLVRKYEPGAAVIRAPKRKVQELARSQPPPPRWPVPPPPESNAPPPPAPAAPPVAEVAPEELPQIALAPGAPPQTAEEYFGLAPTPPAKGARITGYAQSELAYATERPSHRSKFRHTLELGADGSRGPRFKWKVSGRIAYDAVYDLDEHYPDTVKQDQRYEASVRETYADISLGDWDLRVGRQHVVWGEMIGLFFADVVSAKDLREFVLRDFDQLRIPQWAARAEYFRGDFHGEVLWIPHLTYDEIGVPGAEFYPYPPPPPAGYGIVILDENQPHGGAWQAYGVRASYVQAGWDTALFYYDSPDISPTFFRTVVGGAAPAYVYRPDHDRIRQWGATVSKDFDRVVFKGELIYTKDQWLSVVDPADEDGVVRQDHLDYIVGLEYSLAGSSRLNMQVFQRWYLDHVAILPQEELESGYSLYATTRWPTPSIEPQLTYIQSINHQDWVLRPRVVWELNRNWRLSGGADLIGGSKLGLFGRYEDKDRVYVEVRYMF